VGFLAGISLSPKDIFERGGVADILRDENVAGVEISELDYSELLKGEGAEYKDIWLYLLKRSMEGYDTLKLKEIVSTFEILIAKLRPEDFLEDKEMMLLIDKFFKYLKGQDRETFLRCARIFARSVLRAKRISKEITIEKLKEFFNDLGAEELSNILLEQIQNVEGTEVLNFNLFSELVSGQKHQEVAASLTQKLTAGEWLQSNPQALRQIRILFSASQDASISAVYHHHLSSLLESISLGDGLDFDHSRLHRNYRAMLFNLFLLEDNQNRLFEILEAIETEITKAIADNDAVYLELFTKVIDRKYRQFDSASPDLKELQRQVSYFVEDTVLTRDVPEAFGSLISRVTATSKDVRFYLHTLFGEQKINPYRLELFFRLFGAQQKRFYERLQRYLTHIPFMEKTLKSLKGLDPLLAWEICRNIFPLLNDFLKVEILKALRETRAIDEKFLVSILEKGSFLQRKQALLILVRSPRMRPVACRMLLAHQNPLGINTRMIMQNLRLLEGIPLKEAAEYLQALSRYRFFWNMGIRRKARELLGTYGRQ
jgi:hypothetical protein